jgi:hypothetical protein
VSAPSYTPELAKASTYTATPYEVKPQGLVQERLKGIVESDSPLMQQAARIATQKANDRGLISSSMAIGDAQQAVIGAATPIATTDANAINTATLKTADQQNAASQFNAQALTNVGLANQSAANTAKAQNLEGTIQLTNTKMTQDAQLQLAKLDTNTRMALAQMDTKTRSLLQTNQSASNAYVQTITNISNIQNNEKLDAAAKRAAIDTQLTMLREQLGVLERTSSQVDAQTTNSQAVLDLNLGDFFNQIWDQPAAAPTAGVRSTTNQANPAPAPAPASAAVGGRLQALLQPTTNSPGSISLDPSGRVF